MNKELNIEGTRLMKNENRHRMMASGRKVLEELQQYCIKDFGQHLKASFT